METQTDDKPATECECPICQETTETPKITSCQHTFCVSCLDKCLETNHTCPMCRTQIREAINNTNHTAHNLTFNHPIREIVYAARHYNILRVMSGMGGITYSS